MAFNLIGIDGWSGSDKVISRVDVSEYASKDVIYMI